MVVSHHVWVRDTPIHRVWISEQLLVPNPPCSVTYKQQHAAIWYESTPCCKGYGSKCFARLSKGRCFLESSFPWSLKSWQKVQNFSQNVHYSTYVAAQKTLSPCIKLVSISCSMVFSTCFSIILHTLGVQILQQGQYQVFLGFTVHGPSTWVLSRFRIKGIQGYRCRDHKIM